MNNETHHQTIIPIELSNGRVPTKGSEYAAAFDVYAPCDIELKQSRQVIPLGFCVELPMGWKANMRPRSGFSVKGFQVEVQTVYKRYNGETYTAYKDAYIDADVLLGLIDCDFRNECGVILKVYDMNVVADQVHEFDTIVENHVILKEGTRFAQMEVCGGECEFVVVERINRDIDRGGGYGHTGA